MMHTADVVTPILMGATGNISGSFLNIGIAAIAVGAVVFGLRKGWQLFRHLLNEGNGSNEHYSRIDYSGTYDDNNERQD